MIYISLVRLPQRDEVTEGQGRRDGPVARNGTHQYVKWATCPSRSSDWFKLWRGRGWALAEAQCAWSAANYVLHIRRDAPLLWPAVGQEPVDLIFAPTLSAIRHHSVISTSTRKYQLMLPIRVAKVEPISPEITPLTEFGQFWRLSHVWFCLKLKFPDIFGRAFVSYTLNRETWERWSSCKSGVLTRAVESESLKVRKSLKIGKNRIKSEKSDLIWY